MTKPNNSKPNHYPLINDRGAHTANIDISSLTIAQLYSIYASGYCIVTVPVKDILEQVKLDKH